MRFSEEKTFKFGFYCLNALICIYSIFIDIWTIIAVVIIDKVGIIIL